MYTRILNIHSGNNSSTLHTVIQLLYNNQVVALPTETVYGLAGNAFSSKAVKKIFQAKQRPADNPLIVHVGSIEQAKKLVYFDDMSLRFAEFFWPGPLSLLLPIKSSQFSSLVTAQSNYLVVRMPKHPFFLQLLRDLPFPLAAPSANISGRPSPTSAWHVMENFLGTISSIVNGGRCVLGLESTIIQANPFQLLRLGSLEENHIKRVLFSTAYQEETRPKNLNNGATPLIPGARYKHYAPKKPLIYPMQYNDLKKGNPIIVTFGIGKFNSYASHFNLSSKGDLHEAAKNLFHILYKADHCKGDRIAIQSIPNTGIGITINERLHRASSL